MMTFVWTTALNAQTTDDSGIAEEDRTSALVYEFNNDFDIVFEGVKRGLDAAGYEVGYASKRKKLVESKFKILTPEGSDFFDIMEQYGEIPYIRSPSWRSGRVLITTRFEETGSGSIMVTVTAELSAYEERFQNNWVYWNSNGIVEEEVLGAIIVSVQETAEGSDL
jgi:hypothetical protein